METIPLILFINLSLIIALVIVIINWHKMRPKYNSLDRLLETDPEITFGDELKKELK